MIYVVGGFMRSGTTMMMQTLQAGGLPLLFSANREEYLEFGRNDLEAFDPIQHDGKALKAVRESSLFLPPAQYRVVFMRRSEEAIKLSWANKFGGELGVLMTPGRLTARLERITSILKDRLSVLSLHEIWLQDMTADPQAVLNTLVSAGWPIDVAKAAKIPKLSEVKNGF